MTRALKLVPVDPDPAADIYAKWKADIRRRDWAAMHISADRRGFFTMPDARKIFMPDALQIRLEIAFDKNRKRLEAKVEEPAK